MALGRIVAAGSGRQIYLLDDPYIHLAIAKNLLLHGVYGISANEPGMASSSILWPYLLVAAAKLTGGVGVLLPLLLNILCALGLLALVWHILDRAGITTPRIQTAALCLLVLGLPFVSITLIGMEHLLFAVSFLLFLWLAGEDSGSEWGLPLAAALLTASRFEGVFAVFVACLILVRRRPLAALLTAVAGAAPVAASAVYSLRHGGMWLPNSVLLKSTRVSAVAGAVSNGIHNITAPMIWKSGLGELFVLSLWLAWCGRRRPSPLRTMQRIYLGTVLLHLLLARLVSGTTRYDAYLTGGGLLLAVFSLARGPILTGKTARTLAILTLLPLLGYRAVWLEFASTRSAVSIYRQQYQAAQFFAQYYRGQPIVAADAGAVSYFADVHTFDLNGLGNNDTAKLVHAGTFDTAAIDRLAQARGVRAGFLYGDRYDGANALPAQWIRVRSWEIPFPRGVTVSDPIIDFYATSPAEAGYLRESLREFESILPKEVTPLP